MNVVSHAELCLQHLEAQGITAEILGITRAQALHHLDPSRSNELRELWKQDKKRRACLTQFLPEYAKAPNGKAPNCADEPSEKDYRHSLNDRFSDPRERFATIPFDEITLDTTPAYLVKGIVPRTGLCVFWGPPKCGKSFLVFDMMMHVALGWEYRGRKVRQGTVVYCALEGCTAFKNRVVAFRLNRLNGHPNSVPFHLMASPMSLVADHSEFLASLRKTLGRAAPAVIVIDTLNRSLAGSENDDRDMANYVKAADAIRDAFACAIVIVHHCGHEGTRPRGHSSLMGAVDAQAGVKRDALDKIVATVELMKDGPQGEELVSKLQVVEIGLDEDGDRITSCIIEPVEGLAAARNDKAAKLTKGAKIALAALHEAIGECGKVPPASNHIPVGVKCVTRHQWREYAYRQGVSGSDEPRARQTAFQRAHEALVAARQVGVWEPHVWFTQ
jgi:hypothetical protein